MTTFVSMDDGMPDNLLTVPDKSRAVLESLWALGKDGTLWQINPLSRSAMPVINLAELPIQARRQLQRLMLLRWSGPATSSPSSIAHLSRPTKTPEQSPAF